MTPMTAKSLSRRALLRGAALSVPVLGVALTAPGALADPDDEPGPADPAGPGGEPGCEDPTGSVDNCAVELPEDFGSTSFSTTAVSGGTNYSILFNTKISAGPGVPPAATGYKIRTVSVAGTKLDGAPFSL